MLDELKRTDTESTTVDMQRSDVGEAYTVVDTDCHLVKDMDELASYMDEP